MKLHTFPEEFQELITVVANEKHISESAVERDYYIVMMLKALADSPYAEQCVFKGGTSLSKCYPGSIDRFSEDIDLTFLGMDMTNKACDKAIKYILLDEIQFAISKEELRNPDKPVRLYSVLNGLLHLPNVDIYVTGSNSKMLSKDIMTEFRGRGDAVEIHPLSFKEFFESFGGDRSTAFEEYAVYGGLPLVWAKKSDESKFNYLQNLFREVYYKDIQERYNIEFPDILDELVDVLCSAIGSLTNVSKLTNTLRSVKNTKVSNDTIADYLNFLTEAFLFHQAKRYDIKGKKYFEYPSKFYCEDIGLRNIHLNLRQQEETHIMENIIYNDLRIKGYAVDVGVVKIVENGEDGKPHQKSCEIDFIASKGIKKYYIQSALSMNDREKAAQEARPLLAVNDFFRKIIVSKTPMKPWYDENGVLHIGLYDFLLNDDIFE